ncbi:unnamed protein product [Ranitomeya imitator]|uniref:Reverse transcriptase domain-containing protein n=1 Tax=Ranitomeya imitator TaxID=111125 RepID=A0ABN9MMQ5_9NEOB|nr:unnamed protein product [Ranitomeya imitator]
MDVESLCSNITHQDGLNACKFFLENAGTDANSVVKLIKFILTHNYFEFDKKIYLQETGTAMGSKMAPQYANLFLAKLESDFLSSCPIRPLAYYRYIDDILIIWTESEPQLKTFHEQSNQFHPTINLTLNYSCTEINFLDTIIKLQNNKIETSLYQKSIDRPTYLKWDSFHPKHIKNSIVYSQAIRYNRICSNPMDRDEHLGRLRKTFLNQGYHPRTIENQITRATRISRNHLLHYKAKEENNRVPLVVTYNPNLEVQRGAARKLQPLLQKDARLQSIFPDPPLLCLRQPPNLRSIIVKSSLSSPTAAALAAADAAENRGWFVIAFSPAKSMITSDRTRSSLSPEITIPSMSVMWRLPIGGLMSPALDNDFWVFIGCKP